MPIVDTGLWKLNYVEEGSGAPVLLIHGLAGDHTAWRPQIDALKSRYRVIAFDNPGGGRSGAVDKPTSMAEIGQAVLRLMDELKVDRAHVVGRSMGGAIGQEMALAAPDRVQSLALAASFAKLDVLGVRMIENMRDYIGKVGSWTEWARVFSFTFVSNAFFITQQERMTLIERTIADESRDKVSYANLANAVIAADTLNRIGAIRCPTLIMAGRQDPICSPVSTRWMQDRMPQAETVFFEDSSHFFLMEESQKALATLTDWLQRQAA
jgi:pimeloyl-ACP methyl ester carboxylesterase